jgi:hypothetical protein
MINGKIDRRQLLLLLVLLYVEPQFPEDAERFFS